MSTFKERCVALRQSGRSLLEIAQITGRPKTTVYFHIKRIALSAERVAEIRQASGTRIRAYAMARKGKSARSFGKIEEFNPAAVLLLGHLLFDGEIQRGVCAYNNRSQTLIQRVTKLMESIYAYPPNVRTNRHTGVTRVTYFNVALAAYLKQQAHALLDAAEDLPIACKREFLRAFFDDEGCMDFDPPKRRRVRGYQKNVQVLRTIQKLLSSFGIVSRIVLPNEILIVGGNDIKRFEKEINFSAGVCINGGRTNSRWKADLEKRALLRMAIESYRN